MYHQFLLLDLTNFVFVKHIFTTCQRFVANKSANSSFLGGCSDYFSVWNSWIFENLSLKWLCEDASGGCDVAHPNPSRREVDWVCIYWRALGPSARTFWGGLGCATLLGPFLRTSTDSDSPRPVRPVRSKLLAVTGFIHSKTVNWVRFFQKMLI